MWRAVTGFWETILDPRSHLVTESSELHFNSLKAQDEPAFTRYVQMNGHTVV